MDAQERVNLRSARLSAWLNRIVKGETIGAVLARLGLLAEVVGNADQKYKSEIAKGENMKKLVVIAALLFSWMVVPAAAQDTPPAPDTLVSAPRVTLFGGGTYSRTVETNVTGFAASGTFGGKAWRIRCDLIRDNSAGRVTTAGCGAERRFRADAILGSNQFFDADRHEIGLYALGGGVRRTDLAGLTRTSPAILFGAVVDLRVSDTTMVRVGDFAYVYGDRFGGDPLRVVRNSWRYSGGVVFTIGRRQLKVGE